MSPVKGSRRVPRIPQPITGEEIRTHIVALLRADPDRDQWIERLRRTRAQYLVVFNVDPANPSEKLIPPEQRFAESDPAHFERLFSAGTPGAGVVYRIRTGND